MILHKIKPAKWIWVCIIIILPVSAIAQTEIDGLMMGKNEFCTGPMYAYSSWTKYWEGTFERSNANLGRVSSQTVSVMGNYGIHKNINLLFNVPYVSTKSSAGTLKGMRGFQDLSVFIKARYIPYITSNQRISLMGIIGGSLPMSNYTPDFLPLSIGLKSKTATARVMVDYLSHKYFATGSASYTVRSNIKLNRDSYYTTELINSNEVEMPNTTNYNFRTGYRSPRLIVEATVNHFNTLGGFDITKNNMPFPSNNMDATAVGGGFKYIVLPQPELSVTGHVETVVKGRNVGKATAYMASILYVFDFNKKN